MKYHKAMSAHVFTRQAPFSIGEVWSITCTLCLYKWITTYTKTGVNGSKELNLSQMILEGHWKATIQKEPIKIKHDKFYIERVFSF